MTPWNTHPAMGVETSHHFHHHNREDGYSKSTHFQPGDSTWHQPRHCKKLRAKFPAKSTRNFCIKFDPLNLGKLRTKPPIWADLGWGRSDFASFNPINSLFWGKFHQNEFPTFASNFDHPKTGNLWKFNDPWNLTTLKLQLPTPPLDCCPPNATAHSSDTWNFPSTKTGGCLKGHQKRDLEKIPQGDLGVQSTWLFFSWSPFCFNRGFLVIQLCMP